MLTPYALKLISKVQKAHNKFNATKTYYEGRWYDSTKEAVFARHLDFCRLAKDPIEKVIEVIPQFKFNFNVNKKHIFAYICDFKVNYADGSVKYYDVKGYKKGAAYNIFVIKKKCIEAQEGITIIEV